MNRAVVALGAAGGIAFAAMQYSSTTLEAEGEVLAERLRKLQLDTEKFSRKVTAAQTALQGEQERLGKLRDSVRPTPVPNPSPVVPTPNPTPDVKPIVPPTPPVPLPPKPVDSEPADGRFGLAKRVYRIAAAVNTSDLRSDCATLASHFRAVAAMIKRGDTDSVLLDKQAYNISVELGKLNKPFLAGHPAWAAPAKQLSAAIEELLNRDKEGIRTNDDWLEVFDEIARGLEAVR